jgi:alkanesulfonate monooxygenase SsuD/methylene tetrahydromethanopterin reductase-like flavin-dependent oxidoreductase (luciferase family)
VVLAKTLATLDALSGGRLDIGVGVGWQREEYEAAGLDFDRRGRLLDHTLEVCQTLWREERAGYASDELQFEAIHMMPKPLQHGGVPIWVGGSVTGPVARRLARFGSGWIPWGPAAEDIVQSIRRMKDLLAGEGCDSSSLQVAGPLRLVSREGGALDIDLTMKGVSALAQGGVTDFRVRPAVSPDRAANLDHLSALVSAFRATVGRPAAE